MAEIVKFKDNRDYRRMYRSGNSFVSPFLVIYVMKNKTGNVRYGITTGKKIGNAVVRSRCRRIIRAAYSACEDIFPKGYDYIITARSECCKARSTDIENFFRKKAVLFIENSNNSAKNNK